MIIEARGLRKSFGRRTVLRDVTLDVASGARLAIVGLNGAGKTTLFRCLLGLTAFDGSLRVAGLDVRTHGRPARARMGYVPQRPPRFEGNLHDLIAFYTRLRHMDPGRVRGHLAAMRLDLDAHGATPVGGLSGGMLQKCLLALALSAEPDLLLLDEPTAHLDEAARREFLDLLDVVPTACSVVMTSHRLSDVRRLAREVAVLADGRVVFHGTVEDLTRRARQVTVWMGIDAGARSVATRVVADVGGVCMQPSRNGSLAVHVAPSLVAELIHRMRAADVPINDLWVEGATLMDEIVEGAAAPAPPKGPPE